MLAVAFTVMKDSQFYITLLFGTARRLVNEQKTVRGSTCHMVNQSPNSLKKPLRQKDVTEMLLIRPNYYRVILLLITIFSSNSMTDCGNKHTVFCNATAKMYLLSFIVPYCFTVF